MTAEEYSKLALPGTRIYEVSLTCDELCKKQPQLAHRYKSYIHCKKDALCYYKVAVPFSWDVRLLEVPSLQESWGVTIFATEVEAEAAACAIAESRIALLSLLGFFIQS